MTQTVEIQAASRNIIKMPREYASTASFSSTPCLNNGCLFVVTEGIRAIFTRPDLASSIPAQIIPTELQSLQNSTDKKLSDEYIYERIKSAFEKANLTLYNEKLSRPDQMRDFSGSSSTCVLILGRKAFIGQVGISRVYLFRNHTLQQLTHDHSVYANRESKDEVDDINKFAWSQHLIRALGHKETIATDIFVRPLEIGDRLLLCSSAIWLFIPEVRLTQFLDTVNEPEIIAQEMVEALSEIGRYDVSFSVIQIDDK